MLDNTMLCTTIPRGSYPTPFLGYLVLWLGSPIYKSRYLKKGVGYEPMGTILLQAPHRHVGAAQELERPGQQRFRGLAMAFLKVHHGT